MRGDNFGLLGYGGLGAQVEVVIWLQVQATSSQGRQLGSKWLTAQAWIGFEQLERLNFSRGSGLALRS